MGAPPAWLKPAGLGAAAPFNPPKSPLRGRAPLPASPPNSPSAMGMAPSPAAPGARPSPFCGWGGSGAGAPGRARGRVAGLCWSRGSGGGVLWKDSDELLRLGQPECGSWGGRGKGGVRGAGGQHDLSGPRPSTHQHSHRAEPPPPHPQAEPPRRKKQGSGIRAENPNSLHQLCLQITCWGPSTHCNPCLIMNSDDGKDHLVNQTWGSVLDLH